MDYSRLGPLGRYVDRERMLHFPRLTQAQVRKELVNIDARTQEIFIGHLSDFYADCFQRDPKYSPAPEMMSVLELCEKIVDKVREEVSSTLLS